MNVLSQLRRRPELRIKLRLGWIGYRGVALILTGAIWVCLGLDVLADPAVDPNLWHTLLPMPLRVMIWGGAGVIALTAALLPRWEVLGFAGLFIGPFERLWSFAGALIGEPSWTRLTGVLVYLFMSAIVALLAVWPEPTIPDKAVS